MLIDSLWARQLRVILWKNYLLKKANIISFLAEIFIPVLFMCLLIYIKSIVDVYDSPNVSYYCGNVFPWFYSASVDDVIQSGNSFIPFSCAIKPATCIADNYYPIEFGDDYSYNFNGTDYESEVYAQLGYISSPLTDGRSASPFYAVTVQDTTTLYNDAQTTNPSVPFQFLAERLVKFKAKLAILPKVADDPVTANQATALQRYLRAKYITTGSFILSFSSEDQLEDYVNDPDYNHIGYKNGKIAYAIVLNSVNLNEAQWDYTLRLNYTSPFDEHYQTVACISGRVDAKFSACSFTYTVPSTKYYTSDLYKPQSAEYMNGYLYSGFATIQQVVDTYIINQYSSTQVNIQSSVGLMPTEAYLSDSFQYTIQSVLGIFYMLSFLYPVSRLVRVLVLDKETKIKEGMKMMGLSDTIYSISWYITLFLQMTFISILITVVTASSVFQYSNKIYIFAYFEAFSIAVVSMCFLLATLFSRSKVASLIAPMIFFASFFPYYAVSDDQFNLGPKLGTCLLAPACFALGADVVANYEGGLVGIQATNYTTLVNSFSFSNCIGMLIFDAFLYGFLAWYLDKVVPSEFGTPLPFYFLFLPSYWFGGDYTFSEIYKRLESKKKNPDSKGSLGERFEYRQLSNNDSPVKTSLNTKYFEQVSSDLYQQQVDGKCVSIRNLTKIFKTLDVDRVAVDSLTADFYEGQVTILLGHNGAGKSTTINMLTGITPPTSGDVYLRGKSLSSDMNEIRKMLGVCPQHDVLFPELTVMQHLQIFASFKGVASSNADMESKKIIAEVGLLEKATFKASQLSGGQKRKLSLGIALIGDSKICILDEPTSGMDPYSRRSTWNIIQKNKRGRVILLSTHFMDEADILGDQIFIMAGGKLQTAGSPLFLKGVFGCGYTLHCVKASQSQDSSIISSLVFNYIPEATIVSNVGTEQTFRLPFSSSIMFSKLFNEFDAIKDSAIIEYGISVTTLEEVFLRVGKGIEDKSLSEVSVGPKDLNSNKVVIPLLNEKDYWNCFYRPSQLQYSNQLQQVEIQDILQQSLLVAGISHDKYSTLFSHFWASFMKRFIYGKRDGRVLICQLILPIVLVAVGLSILLIIPNLTQPDLILSPRIFNPSFSSANKNYVPMYISNDGDIDTNTFPIDLVNRFSGDDDNGVYGKAVLVNDKMDDIIRLHDDYFAGCAQGATPLFNTSTFLLASIRSSEEQGSSRYGALTISSTSTEKSLLYNILVNGSANHGVGIYANLMHEAFLQVVSNKPRAKIIVHSHPFDETYSQKRRQSATNSFVAALFISIAFCFIPSSYATFVVKEKETKSKFQQMISGCNITSYWLANLTWDFLSYLPTAGSVLLLLYLFNISSFIKGQGPLAISLVLISYGLAVASFTYMFCFPFKSHSTAQIIHMFGNFVTGLCLMITHFVLTLVLKTQAISAKLRYLFRLFPSFCLGDSFLMLALCSDGKTCPSVTSTGFQFSARESPLAWDVVGGNIVFLFGEAIIYFLITLMIEYLLTFPSLMLWLHAVDDPGLTSSFFDEEDEDVREERNRVIRGEANNEVVRLESLRKAYPMSGSLSGPLQFIKQLIKSIFGFPMSSSSNKHVKVAVQSLSFGIPKGECFGFLGINGAGKSTTLSILCGEFPCTSGKAYIDGHNIHQDQSNVRRKIGFCPQYDALLELLTVREHLELYASIKGISCIAMNKAKQLGYSKSDLINCIVMNKMKQLDLLDFENKVANSLSGGNKRKLSVAIALIGNPSIVYLDEPSTGMDPGARRAMWDVISKISTQDGLCSIILTTHSLEEAEALCTRIGIMVNGRLRCLGSTTHLKEKFGSGFEINIKTIVITIEMIEKFMKRFDRSSEVIVIQSSDIESWCQRLGNPSRFQTISSFGEGRVLYDILQVEGCVSIPIFIEWWLAENQADNITQFFESFKSLQCESILLERATSHSFRYRLLKGNTTNESILSLGLLFEMFEKQKERLEIMEYSIGQTTLEQIFNQFASSQDNPEVQAIQQQQQQQQQQIVYDEKNSLLQPLL